jgi:hypothetical protein
MLMFNSLMKISEKRPVQVKSESAVGEELYGNSLFEALVCEFHTTSLLIGGVTNVINASAQKGQRWFLRSCRNVLPVEAAVTSVALKNWDEIAITKTMAQSISRVYLNMADAKRPTEGILDALGPITGSEVSTERIQQLAMLWRQLSDDCRLTVRSLETETRWRLNELYTANALVLGKMLRDAAEGGTSCVDGLGNVILPVLPQRRKEVRFTLLQKCAVTHRNTTLSAIARDISRSGMGIKCGGDLRLRDSVVIELKNGRRFKGRVVWINDGNQGIQFDEILSVSDPFLAA